jgi:hypothetical protein
LTHENLFLAADGPKISSLDKGIPNIGSQLILFKATSMAFSGGGHIFRVWQTFSWFQRYILPGGLEEQTLENMTTAGLG